MTHSPTRLRLPRVRNQGFQTGTVGEEVRGEDRGRRKKRRRRGREEEEVEEVEEEEGKTGQGEKREEVGGG